MLDVLVVATTFVLFTCGVEFATVDAASDGKSIPPIYWNTSAPIFKDHHNYVQRVKIGQKMDIICPILNPGQKDGSYYFVLYQVSKTHYDNCDTDGQKRLLTCNSPAREKKYTFLFEDITPSPWGLTFRPGETYYFISTSDGTMAGLNNSKGGACTEKNMKLKIAVNPRDDPNDQYPPPRPVDPELIDPNQGEDRYHRPPTPKMKPMNPVYQNQPNQASNQPTGQDEEQENKGAQGNLNSNGLIIGVVLGGCAVLFVVLLAFLGYKVHRRRRNVKKYQSPGISASRGPAPQAQVTLLPISSHHGTHLRSHTARSASHHPLEMQDLPAPPPYNESLMDHAGSTMEV